MATNRSRKNPASTNIASRLPHVNTTQREGDINGVFNDFFRHLADLRTLPNGFELHSMSEPPNGTILDGAFIVLQHDNMKTGDFFPFLDWIINKAAEFGIFLYSLPSLPADSRIIVLRLYIR